MRRRYKGFTLLEIVISLGILAAGLTSVIAMFVHNARLAEMAREQIVQAILFGDLKSKQQLAAMLPGDQGLGKDTFDANNWGLIQDSTSMTWAAGKTKYDALVDAAYPEYQYDNIDTYRGFIFRVEPFYFKGGAVGMKGMDSPIRDKWRFQFTDFDGFEPSVSVWKKDANGNIDYDDPASYEGERILRVITEADIHQDVNDDGVIDPDTPVGPVAGYLPTYTGNATGSGPGTHYNFPDINEFRFGPAFPNVNLTWDETGMRHYWKRVKCTLAWYLPSDPVEVDAWFTDAKNLNLGRYRIYDFTVYNPDVDKE